MQASVVYWLSANYRASGALSPWMLHHAVMMRNAMQELAKRWTRRFDDTWRKKLADRFANDAIEKRGCFTVHSLQDAGFYCRVQDDLADE